MSLDDVRFTRRLTGDRNHPQIDVRNDCSGRPGGCVELWLRRPYRPNERPDPVEVWEQAHMTLAEARALRAALGRAIEGIEQELAR